MIPAEAVEAAAKIWQELDRREGYGEYPISEYAEDVTAMLEAAAPYMLATAWAAGHESGFWNGRESTGSGEMEFCGVEHAKANNPYTGANE